MEILHDRLKVVESLVLPLKKGDRVEFLYLKDNKDSPMRGTIDAIARGSGAGNANIPVFRVIADNPPPWFRNDSAVNFHPRAALRLIDDEG